MFFKCYLKQKNEAAVSTEMKVDLKRVKVTPGEPVLPAHRMVFSADGQRLITATSTADVQVLEVMETGITVRHTFTSSNGR